VINKFTDEIRGDFESEILPKLEKLMTLNDCVEYYRQFPFWGDRLKEMIENENKFK
jgi:hypothetical protein